MNQSFAWIFIVLVGGWLFAPRQSSVTEASNPLEEREDVRDIRREARELLKKPPAKKRPRDKTKLPRNFTLPDFIPRARKNPVIRQMKRSIAKFNNNPDGDAAMTHLGEPGTFVWMQGRRRLPRFILGPDCYSRIIRENEEDDRVFVFGFFGRFISRFRGRSRRRRFLMAHARNSRKLLSKKIKHIAEVHQRNKAKLKERILKESSKRLRPAPKSRKGRAKRDAILDFLHIKPRRKLLGIPAQTQATIDDSYIHVTSFARPPEQQSSLVRYPADNTTTIVATRLILPKRHIEEKKTGPAFMR